MQMLRGLRVIEFAGLAPVPLAGLVLQDFGAEVIRIDKANTNTTLDRLGVGKKSLALNLKDTKSLDIVKELTNKSDVVLEPFRPGVMERLGLGPEVLCEDNPRLIYTRLTGFGQKGPLASMAGHDINYLGYSGSLSLLGRAKQNPTPPANFLADFAGGSMMSVMGILLAVIQRANTGKGDVIDASMVDGASYVSTFAHTAKAMGIWGNPQGMNLLDTGSPFYDSYKTKDKRHMAIGSIEPQFYKLLIQGLGLDPKSLPHQMDFKEWPKLRATFTEKFLEKTQEEWTAIFSGELKDACVTPILNLKEWSTHENTVERQNVRTAVSLDGTKTSIPSPAPKFNSMVGKEMASELKEPQIGEHSAEILENILGYDKAKIEALSKEGVVKTI